MCDRVKETITEQTCGGDGAVGSGEAGEQDKRQGQPGAVLKSGTGLLTRPICCYMNMQELVADFSLQWQLLKM